MLIEIIVTIILVIFYLTLTAAVFLRNRGEKTNIFFALFALCANFFTVAVFFENKPEIVGYEWVGFFLRLDFVAALLVFVFLYYFSVYFTNIFPKKKITKLLHKIMLVMVVINIPLIFS